MFSSRSRRGSDTQTNVTIAGISIVITIEISSGSFNDLNHAENDTFSKEITGS